jgi:hypothetical protein
VKGFSASYVATTLVWLYILVDPCTAQPRGDAIEATGATAWPTALSPDARLRLIVENDRVIEARFLELQGSHLLV